MFSGGMDKVTQEKLWTKISQDMGYSQQNKNLGNILKAHYERILYPLDVFEREEKKKAEALKQEMVRFWFLCFVVVYEKFLVRGHPNDDFAFRYITISLAVNCWWPDLAYRVRINYSANCDLALWQILPLYLPIERWDGPFRILSRSGQPLFGARLKTLGSSAATTYWLKF